MNTDPSAFSALGYCVSSEVLTQNEVATVREELDGLIAAMPADMEVVGREGKTTRPMRPEYLVEPHMKHAYWLELCRHPRVLDAVEAVLGPDLALIMSHLIVKRPHDGLPVKWHQDNTYWPSVDGTDVITVWLAIDDVDRENGCMKVIPSTHAGYPELERVFTDGKDLLGVETHVTPEMGARAVLIELKAGDLSIHDSYILHGSETNTSARRRAGYTMRYANTKTVQIDVEKHWVPVYLCRGEQTDAARQYVDIRPGQHLPELKDRDGAEA